MFKKLKLHSAYQSYVYLSSRSLLLFRNCNKTKIAIIGTGLCSLSVSHFLKDIAKITFFEKTLSVSGRMSLRLAGIYFFDHGAQYFTAKTKVFHDYIQPLIG